MTSRAGSALGVLEVVLGAATMARAPRVASASWWVLDARAMTVVVGFLGARQAVQGAVTLAAPRPAVLRVGAAVDLLHALSLAPVIAAAGPYREAAGTSAALAVATAGLALAAGARS